MPCQGTLIETTIDELVLRGEKQYVSLKICTSGFEPARSGYHKVPRSNRCATCQITSLILLNTKDFYNLFLNH